MGYKTKKELEAFNFTNRPKEELSKINSGKSKAKSDGAKKRHFRENNPDIQILMEYYKSGDPAKVMEKYMEDNEEFMKLYHEADNPKEKSDILAKYMNFQFKTFELLVGTKSQSKNFNANLDVNKTVAAAIMKRLTTFKEENPDMETTRGWRPRDENKPSKTGTELVLEKVK